jgi:WD40 repeat protein
MTDVMISYSRLDKDFAYRFAEAIVTAPIADKPKYNWDIWIDKEDIGIGKSWWDRIKKGIEEANNVVIIYSDNYLASEVCNEELAYSLQLGKTIIPIWLTSKINPDDYRAKQQTRQANGDWVRNPLSLADDHFNRLSLHNSLNGIFYKADPDNFDVVLKTVVDAVFNDLDYKEGLTKWNNRVIRWQANNQATRYLLQGADIEEAERWRDNSIAKKQDVSQVADYITKSRIQLRRNQGRLLASAFVGLVVMSVLAIVSLFLFREAQSNLQLANIRGTDVALEFLQSDSQRIAADARNALSEENPQLALPLAIAAANRSEDVESEVLRVLGDAVYHPNAVWDNTTLTKSAISVDINADDTLGAIASTDGTVRLLDMTTGDEVRQLLINTPNIIATSLQFSPIEPIIAVAFTDGTVRLFDVTSGNEQLTIGTHDGIATVLTYSNDGLVLASGGTDKYVRLWDTTTNKLMRRLSGHKGVILSLAFNANSKLLASGAGDELLEGNPNDITDRTVRLWDVATGELQGVVAPKSGYVRSIAFPAQYPEYIVVAIYDRINSGTVRFFNISNGEEDTKYYISPDTISDVILSGNLIIATGRDGVIHILDMNTGEVFANYTGFRGPILSMDINASNTALLIGQGDIGGDYGYQNDQSNRQDVMLWDLEDRSSAWEDGRYQDWLWAIDVSSDGQYLAVGGGEDDPKPAIEKDKTIYVQDLETNEMVAELSGHTDTVGGVRFVQNNTQLISVGWDSRVLWWNLENGALIRDVNLACGQLYAMDVRPQGDWLVVGCQNGKIYLLDVANGDILREYQAHEGALNDLDFRDDGLAFASASDDRTAKVWDVLDSATPLNVINSANRLQTVAFTPDNRLVIGGDNSELRIRDLQASTDTIFLGHNGIIWGVAVSRDGQSLLSASSDESVILWDIATGQQTYSYTEHTNFVQDVIFAPDEQIAYSIGQDAAIFAWHINPTREKLLEFAQQTRYIRELTCNERVAYGIVPLCNEP